MHGRANGNCRKAQRLIEKPQRCSTISIFVLVYRRFTIT